MKRYIDHFFLFAFILFLTACRGDEEWSMASSGFLISLGDEQTNITSRATPAEIGKPVADKFQLRITKKETNSILYNGAYKSGLIQASTGNYTLVAFCGDNPELAWDTPYYEGITEAEVLKDQTTSVNIPCKVANALLSIHFSNPDKFAQLYNSYNVKVTVGSSSLNFDNSETKKSAYFREGSKVTLTFHATVKETGKEVSMVIENDNLPQTFAAGTHTKLSLTAAKPTSGTILEVDKVEVEKVTVTQTIPLEWLPKPKVTGFSGNTILNYTETADAPSEAVLSYTASSPIQDIEFTLDFKDPQYSGYNKRYILSELTEEERGVLEGIGMKLPVLDGISTKGTLDLSTLIANLQTNAGAEVINTIKLNVKANNRWSNVTEDGTKGEGENYEIKVVKPEFTVDVQPGNVWTKEFTIDEIVASTGKAENIKKNLVYQYSADGGSTWQECSNLIKFDAIPTNKNYKVKACYRNCINSNNVAEVTLEEPTQIPNSDMEDWYIETKKKSGGWPFKDKTYYTFHPYANGASNLSWWDTNNDKAQGGTYLVGIWYEGCFASCVSYTEDAHQGSKAALMYLSGCGDSYANTGATYVGGAMVGSLFIGSYNSGIVQGHAFASRPTSLSFWYKYKPYNSDAFKVAVSLKNGDEEIATGTYIPEAYSVEDGSYTEATVHLNYSKADKKATTICVQFLASNKSSLSESDFVKGTTINYPTIGDWTVHMGSVLKIDDLSLNYSK